MWEKHHDLKEGVNYLKECSICIPKYCYVGGFIDGFLYKKDGTPIIVEFKGLFKGINDKEPASGNLKNFNKKLL